MKKHYIFFLIPALLLVAACKQKKNIPTVDAIPIALSIHQFESNFFSIDTNNIDAALQTIRKQYPSFTEDYVFNILGIPQNKQAINANIKSFISTYHKIYTDSKNIFTTTTINQQLQQIQQALQFVKYYFPNYTTPTKVVTFIGPFNSYANIVTSNNEIAIGLQLYMGSNYAVYATEELQQLYPAYVSRKFSKEYIVVNTVKNIIEDIQLQFPVPKSNNLIEEIITMGKQQYLLNAFLPYEADSIKLGYTTQQTIDCFNNEKAIYTMFIKNNLLFETDKNIIAPYITDGPNTETLGKDSPGKIGVFMGWKIVEKWMQQHKNISLTQLLQTPPQTIFNEAKYKP